MRIVFRLQTPHYSDQTVKVSGFMHLELATNTYQVNEQHKVVHKIFTIFLVTATLCIQAVSFAY
ncbi:hypothetical protein SERLA73DRAFT_129827 [Serpula lacrymans var. lacrymans S7.3]|uniref:Uncharacterized protein n=2 Tax=Serpula lacrymans var. lacrymans TaxID=341189 RepID=F8PJT3_SERL3|nr:uncharacterized protein SERLADRAFT_377843 [Serpula lacrymans var. lacrymans S7.9]EGO03493.1 hypothetical protein SERLA73DRAFT_129827 [Serpula lacrymans var. lacrymans S7.3]EGO29246.1 hypothetical protein SERLADRAFT_377843 [Serpula lacrymans var. lacrymans S7.9]